MVHVLILNPFAKVRVNVTGSRDAYAARATGWIGSRLPSRPCRLRRFWSDCGGFGDRLKRRFDDGFLRQHDRREEGSLYRFEALLIRKKLFDHLFDASCHVVLSQESLIVCESLFAYFLVQAK